MINAAVGNLLERKIERKKCNVNHLFHGAEDRLHRCHIREVHASVEIDDYQQETCYKDLKPSLKCHYVNLSNNPHSTFNLIIRYRINTSLT